VTGITIMLTDPGMDTGPIIAQQALEIEPRDTTETLSGRLAALGAELLIETLPEWLGGSITPRAQDDAQATYAPPIAADAGAIDWRRPAAEIDRLIRAYTPWPGAFTTFQGMRLKIVSAHATPHFAAADAPGKVVEAERSVGVVTGEGVLWLETVQLAGRKAMPARQLALGQRDLIGAVLPC